MIMPFGKYEDKDLEDIPSDYLKWIIDKVKNDDNLVEAADEEYTFREKWKTHFWKEAK
jgi:uncharacterized protein (DUF3820 family)